MPQIEIGPDMIQIDAQIVAKALKLPPHELQSRMREGTVTSRFERGEGVDAGRMRLTFFSSTRRARITADESGAVLSCTAVDYVGTPKAAPPAPDATPTQMSPRDRLEALLDEALEGSFPASDPIAISFDKE
ncbi:MAG: DUF6522 family protein [Rhodobacterales bacterium]|nr:DUF6522 family protein [Rhodobacterales bacterium]